LRLDDVTDGEFVETMTPLFEGAPRFLARLTAARPFGSVHGLFGRALDIALSMPEEEQVELVDAHPRLGAPPASVSVLSYHEQGYDRAALTSSRGDTAAELERLNDAYERRFGFRYCVFVAGRPREALLPDMRSALNGDRSVELQRGLRAVVDIARDRYAKTARDAGA
jgi:2-oxo-4-hydroxy-4-carboxy--5-ureidoimidazoline (OHCU) decarboxylase